MPACGAGFGDFQEHLWWARVLSVLTFPEALFFFVDMTSDEQCTQSERSEKKNRVVVAPRWTKVLESQTPLCVCVATPRCVVVTQCPFVA